MELFLFFRLWFCWVYDSTYDFNFWFSLGRKFFYDFNYDYDSDYIASENQPLESMVSHS